MNCVSQSLDPVTLRRVFLLSTQHLYSDPRNYAEQQTELSRFVFSQDEKIRTLDVELDYVYNPARLSARHAVYVGVSDLTFTPHSLNNQAGATSDLSGGVYSQFATAEVMVRCVSPLPDEALRLATAAAGFYFGMRPKFMSELQLQRFDIQRLTKPALIEKAPTILFESALVCSLAFNFEITSINEGHRIKTFQMSTTGETRFR